jgi:peptide/nickel transport system substrate-binding protein
MPPDLLKTLPGYDPRCGKEPGSGARIDENLGYGSDKHLAVTVSTRNLAPYRDPAVIFIDQLKQIYMDGVLDPVDTTDWYPKVMRKDYTVGLNITETAVDDPDPAFYENYVCGAMRNYTGCCNPELDKMVDKQSAMSDVAKRKQMVWAIEKKLADDDARPILFYPRAANCYYPKVKGLVTQANSIYNGQRFEDLWLDN